MENGGSDPLRVKLKKHLKQGTLKIALSSRATKTFKQIPPLTYYINLRNRMKYGPSAPKYGEIIWFTPDDSTMIIPDRHSNYYFGFFNEPISARIVDFSFQPVKAVPITKTTKLKKCIDHWNNGIPWEDTGLYDEMHELVLKKGSHDGCKNFNDIVKRYEKLDQIFYKAKRDGKLLNKTTGFLNIGPNREVYWSGGGQHRLAIAYILKIPMPAKIGLVHVSAISYLSEFRVMS